MRGLTVPSGACNHHPMQLESIAALEADIRKMKATVSEMETLLSTLRSLQGGDRAAATAPPPRAVYIPRSAAHGGPLGPAGEASLAAAMSISQRSALRQILESSDDSLTRDEIFERGEGKFPSVDA